MQYLQSSDSAPSILEDGPSHYFREFPMAEPSSSSQMPETPDPGSTEQSEQRQSEQPQVSLFAEFYEFLFHNASFWIAPILLVLALLGVLVWLTSGGMAPFIYSMF